MRRAVAGVVLQSFPGQTGDCSTTIWLSGRANLVDRSEGAC
jgi:hypothetical protein